VGEKYGVIWTDLPAKVGFFDARSHCHQEGRGRMPDPTPL